MPTLFEVVRDLDTFDSRHTIYAADPWSAASAAVVALELEAGSLPPLARDLDLKYFLEIFIAREFLQDWRDSIKFAPTAQSELDRLIQYATFDA